MDNRINFRKGHSRTKWGGTRDGTGKPEIKGEWYCQSCGTKQVVESPVYLFEVFEKEYIRICSDCYHLHKLGIDMLNDLKKIMGVTKDWFY